MKIGITGSSGFIGYHLKNSLIYAYSKYELIFLSKEDFNNSDSVDAFTNQSDIIIHLAGINRHKNEEFIYSENIRLSKVLIESLEKNNFKGKIIFASSIQEKTNSIYGQAKKKCFDLFKNSSQKTNYKFINLLIPNVYGPFCMPNYNSFIATFCYNLVNNKDLIVKSNQSIPVIYVASLVKVIINLLEYDEHPESIEINEVFSVKPNEVKEILLKFKNEYLKDKIIPNFSNIFEKNLFNTLITYVDIKHFFPYYNLKHVDERGFFTEVSKVKGNAQFSYSITKPKITRGNHFHTNKVERFTVIEGNALIKIRKVGSKEVIEFEIKKDKPASIDMIPWHTHSITNIGEKDLITLFSINDIFDRDNPDTFSEIV